MAAKGNLNCGASLVVVAVVPIIPLQQVNMFIDSSFMGTLNLKPKSNSLYFLTGDPVSDLSAATMDQIAEEQLPNGRMSAHNEPSNNVYLAAAAALMGAIGMGTVVGYTAPALPSLSEKSNDPDALVIDPNDEETQSWIGSSMTLGALVGGLLAGPLISTLGRKNSLILYGLPFIVGWFLIFAARNVGLIIGGRVVTGLCCGLVSCTAPIYVSEISTPSVRGFLGTCFQVGVTVGILLVAVFGWFLNWRWLAFVCTVPPILMSVCMAGMPETPAWLLSKQGRTSVKAQKAVTKLRSLKSDIDAELDEIHEETRGNTGSMWLSGSQMRQKDVSKPFTLALLLMFFQQFTGINVVIYYQTQIIKDTGTSINPYLGTIISCCAQVLATIGSSFLIDRLGRRVLLLISSSGQVVSLFFLGLHFYLSDGDEQFTKDYFWLPLVCLVVYIVSFSLGWGPIPWMMIPEMTPNMAKSLIGAVSTAFNWFCAFIVTKGFASLKHALKPYGAFWSFGIITLMSIFFVALFLPETRGKTLKDIQAAFRGQSPSISSSDSPTKQLPSEEVDEAPPIEVQEPSKSDFKSGAKPETSLSPPSETSPEAHS